jgi:hypothetical protein
MKFAEVELEFKNPLKHNSFFVTSDEEIIVKGSNSKSHREACEFYIFDDELKVKAKINLRDNIYPDGVEIVSAQTITKIDEHYIVLAFGQNKKEREYFYSTLVYKDDLEGVKYLGEAVWGDEGRKPAFRNLISTEEGVFGLAQIIKETKIVGSYWREIGFEFNKSGAVIYDLQNQFFKSQPQTGVGITSNFTNSWVVALDEKIYMLTQAETVISVAGKERSYYYKSKSALPLSLDGFTSYNTLFPSTKGKASRYDTQTIDKKLLRENISVNTGLYHLDGNLIVGYRSPLFGTDQQFDLTLQMITIEGATLGEPLFISNAWLAGVVNGKVFIVERIAFESDAESGFIYSPFEITAAGFESDN